jgi:deazaflavin-dependent oxidoreductase (nitroreductase family)
MTTLSPQFEENLRLAFKYFNRFMLLMWRLGLGRWVNCWPEYGGQIMVLVHKGRKTGLTRRTPLNYALVDGELYCTAGFGAIADWYRNTQANPAVEVWLPNGWWAGSATEITDPVQWLPLMRQVLIGSGFAAPAAGLHPKTMTDAELAAAAAAYRLVQITRTQPLTGPTGPGDLAWVWPLATTGLLALLLIRKKRR